MNPTIKKALVISWRLEKTLLNNRAKIHVLMFYIMMQLVKNRLQEIHFVPKMTYCQRKQFLFLSSATEILINHNSDFSMSPMSQQSMKCLGPPWRLKAAKANVAFGHLFQKESIVEFTFSRSWSAGKHCLIHWQQ